MTRLDVWLVQGGFFSSRQAAKRAIQQGLVTVNGAKAKPSRQVSGKEEIEVSDEALDFPIGYSKLNVLNNAFPTLVTSTTQALDVGSSAGGFLNYLAERCRHVTGIEVSDEFIDALQEIVRQYDNVSVVIDNAFTLDPYIVSREGSLDLLLIDVTTEPLGTLKLIEKYSSLLISGGWLVAAFKANYASDTVSNTIKEVEKIGFYDVSHTVLQVSRKEFHIVGKRH